MSRKHERGLGMVEIIVAAGLGLLVVAGVSTSLQNSTNFSRKMESSVDLSNIKTQITASVDCNATMAGRTMGSPCPTDTYIALKGRTNNTFVNADGSTVFGEWNVRALCKSNGLHIRAAKLTTGSGGGRSQPASSGVWNIEQSWSDADKKKYFKNDEVNRTLYYTWEHPKTNLFGSSGTISLCKNWFTALPTTADCSGSNQFVKSINLADGTVTCGTIPTCGLGEFVRFNGSSFQCASATSDPNITTYVTNTATNAAKNTVTNTFGTVQTYSASGGDVAESATVYCPAGWYRVSCAGSRQPNLVDSCAEEACGFIGVMPVGSNGCKVGIDSQPGYTNPTVYITCIRVP